MCWHTNPLVKDAAVFGLMKNDEGPQVHAVLLLEEPDKAKTVIQQANKQLAAHQQIRGFTIWPDADFPRTNTLKVKRPDVLDALHGCRHMHNSDSKGKPSPIWWRRRLAI